MALFPEVVADTMVPAGEMPTTDQRIETAVDGDPNAVPVVLSDPEPITPPEPKTYITVILQFVVTATGDINRIVVTRKANPLLDAEAERVVSILPKWKPGKQDGNPVAVYFSLPVVFRIK